MKLAASEIKAPSSQPSHPPSSQPRRLGKDESGFFRTMCKAAEITKKELVYECRVSDTLVDGWFNGSKNDPFTQARKAVSPFMDRRRRDLLPAIVAYIIGVDNFDEVVLERIQQVLVKVVQP
jgi:hypothetical protein